MTIGMTMKLCVFVHWTNGWIADLPHAKKADRRPLRTAGAGQERDDDLPSCSPDRASSEIEHFQRRRIVGMKRDLNPFDRRIRCSGEDESVIQDRSMHRKSLTVEQRPASLNTRQHDQRARAVPSSPVTPMTTGDQRYLFLIGGLKAAHTICRLI